MNKFARSALGVTLLEVMLVLAIAAMIIVMSVRYYQTASSNQMAIAALDMIQGITSLADGIEQSSQSYSSITTSAIQALMPSRSMQLPWGDMATITGQGENQYNVSLANTPKEVCELLKIRLSVNKKFQDIDTNPCVTITDFHYTYDATQ